MIIKTKKSILSRVLLFMFLFVFMIVGCADGGDYKETNMENMIELTSWHFTSGVPNNLITVHYPDEKAKIEIVADDGYLNNKESKQIICPETTISWTPGGITATKSKTFISVIITVDDNIEAYGIVKIYRQNNSSWSDAKSVVLKSVLIKNQTNGSNIVSREYINSLLEELKKQ